MSATLESTTPEGGLGAGFVSHSAVLLASTAVTAALSALYLAGVARVLGPIEYGVVTSLLSLAFFFSLVLTPVETGISKLSAACHGRRSPGQLATLAAASWRFIGLLAVAVAVLFWLCGPLTRELLHIDDPWVVVWTGAFLATSFLACVARGLLRGDHRFRAYSAAQVVESAGRLALGLLLVTAVGGAGSALAGYALGAAAFVLASLWCLRDLRAVPREPLDLRGTFFPLAAVYTHVYFVFIANADMLVARHSLGEVEAGLFGAATTLTRLLGFAAKPVELVLFSRVVSLQAQRRSSRRLAVVVSTAITLGLAASCVIPWLFGEQILTLLFGPHYAGGGELLLLLWLSTALMVLQSAASSILFAIDRTRGFWLFLLPCGALLGLFARFHGSAVQLAWCDLAVGGATTLVLGVVVLRLLIQTRPAAPAA